MKKALFTQLVFLLVTTKISSQSLSKDSNVIQKFVDATVLIPFMASVANVQGVVNVRVTKVDDDSHFKYEIAQSLRPDCDKEALRVVELINYRNLISEFSDKKTTLIQVPFFNKKKVKFENGYVLNYFDSNKKLCVNESEIKYFVKYPVDTLSGLITDKAQYYEYKNKSIKAMDSSFFYVDSSEIYTPTLFENILDSIQIHKFTCFNTDGFSKIFEETYKNGQFTFRTIGNDFFYYYPNGRIKKVSEEIEIDSEKIIKEINWYANGQILSLSTYTKAQPNDAHKFIAVWDTLGRKIVENGEGMAEFYETNGVEKGLIKTGFKDGTWIKKNMDNVLEYKESYDIGNLLEGIRYLGQDSAKYNVVDIRANFKEGMKWFSKHLATNLRYPIDAMKSGIQGTVLVGFTVCTDGTLCDYTIINSAGESCNKEALRVVKMTSGKWRSAKNRGFPVKSKLVLPVTFQSLGIINR